MSAENEPGSRQDDRPKSCAQKYPRCDPARGREGFGVDVGRRGCSRGASAFLSGGEDMLRVSCWMNGVHGAHTLEHPRAGRWVEMYKLIYTRYLRNAA